MRAINVLLCFVVSLALGLAVLEGGLRLLGLGPVATLNRFDPVLGWSKTPGAVVERSTSEFDVTFAINALGLRDDPMQDPGKPSGTHRTLFLGDSFVLGYTVERQDLFVDLLERWWRAEGRQVDCINAGTEGWSTDQEVLWYLNRGVDFAPDVVVLCTYENDFFWNGETSYLRYQKPRLTRGGELERRTLVDPGAEPWYRGYALGKFFGPRAAEPRHEFEDGARVRGEWLAYWKEPPPPMVEAWARTKGALLALRNAVEQRGGRLVVVPIPSEACIDEDARAARVAELTGAGWIASLRRKLRGQELAPALDPARWSPDEPVERVLAMCRDLAIDAADPRPALKAAAQRDGRLYFRSDWHLNPAGNRALAAFLHEDLEGRDAFPAAYAARQPAALPPPAAEPLLAGWRLTFLALWLALSLVYARTYKKDPLWKGPLVCFGMLALVFTIALGGAWLLSQLTPGTAQLVGVGCVLALVIFLLVKLGRRLGTVVELLWAFTKRGHWYLMPLVVVLLTVGSLLVVAASSPLVAPFIYTLF